MKELNKFASFILGKFFGVIAGGNRKVFAELCFWKTSREAHQIIEGYDKQTLTATERQKKSYWSEDQEETLANVFRQLRDEYEQQSNQETDLLDAITAHFVESQKSRRQVAKKLKDMGLIQVPT